MSSFPGRISQKLLSELEQYVVASPFPFALDISAGQGMWLQTLDGQRLFDWAGYFGSKLIGHNHPRLYEPEYVKRLTVAANNKVANPDFLTPECLDYYRELYALAPACMRNERLEVYCVNSGAEAVENMMKYFINLYLQKKGPSNEAPALRFIYFDQAFHGRTVFALNVTQLTHDPLITRDYHGFAQGNIQVPFPATDSALSPEENRANALQALETLETILQLHKDNIAGIILEPLQGAGGHRLAVPEFYQGLSRLAHEYDVSLGFDEVQTAGGQTGCFFASDLFDLPYPPQAIAAGKKLGCGAVYMLYPMGDHGVLDSTWGGTLADMVRFVQEMKIVRDEQLIEQVPVKTERLTSRLNVLAAAYPALMSNVRGLGLYQGFSLATPQIKSALQEMAREQENLLLLGAGPETIRLRPNLSVTLEEIDLLAEMLGRCLAKISGN
jgi:L-lysine 6-transaminase